jgi:hypothetical protein
MVRVSRAATATKVGRRSDMSSVSDENVGEQTRALPNPLFIYFIFSEKCDRRKVLGTRSLECCALLHVVTAVISARMECVLRSAAVRPGTVPARVQKVPCFGRSEPSGWLIDQTHKAYLVKCPPGGQSFQGNEDRSYVLFQMGF